MKNSDYARLFLLRYRQKILDDIDTRLLNPSLIVDSARFPRMAEALADQRTELATHLKVVEQQLISQLPRSAHEDHSQLTTASRILTSTSHAPLLSMQDLALLMTTAKRTLTPAEAISLRQLAKLTALDDR